MNAKYKAYLLSPTWSAIKTALISDRGSRCEVCQKQTKLLHVHHLTYVRIFKEVPEDLQLLCAPCHRKEHGITGKNKKPKNVSKVEKHIKNPEKVAKGKKSWKLRCEKLTKKNPVEVILKRYKANRYKTLADFNTALISAKKKCVRHGVSFAHLIGK